MSRLISYKQRLPEGDDELYTAMVTAYDHTTLPLRFKSVPVWDGTTRYAARWPTECYEAHGDRLVDVLMPGECVFPVPCTNPAGAVALMHRQSTRGAEIMVSRQNPNTPNHKAVWVAVALRPGETPVTGLPRDVTLDAPPA